jgi:hypothetical protein
MEELLKKVSFIISWMCISFKSYNLWNSGEVACNRFNARHVKGQKICILIQESLMLLVLD